MKKEEKTKITKNKILSFAMEEFGSGGYHGASLNNICGKGIPKGLLYHNYENKDALYLACVRQCYADLLFLFEEGAPMDNLDAYIAVRLKFVEEYPLKAHLIFESMVQPPENLCAEIRKAHKELEVFNRSFFERILEELPLREGVSKEDALTYFSMMQTMFNVYFGSNTLKQLSISERVAEHEKELPRLLKYMMYGIAEQREDM